MILVDTNLVIYIAQLKLEEKSFAGHSINYSVITTIEALGYHELPIDELRILEKAFANSTILPLSDQVVDQAIRVRQTAKMKLGDAIIAATALVHGLELWTNDIEDFKYVDGLKLHNPLGSGPV